MKKFFLPLLALVVVFSVYSQTGVITELTGEVELKPANAANFVRASVGAQIAQDTVISTGFRSTAIISVGSTTLTVRPLTRLTLSEIQRSAGDETLNINLDTGRLRVEVNTPAGVRNNTSVQTPSATASVRGTVFDVDPNGVSFLNGSGIYTDNNGVSVGVGENGSSFVDPDGNVVSSVQVGFDSLTPKTIVGAGESGENTGSIGQTQSGDLDLSFDWDI